MPTSFIYSLYIIGIIVGWIIFYYVVKAAVKNGIKEAHSNKEMPAAMNPRKSEMPTNQDQIRLQQRYDKGEISFEVYKSEWNKLST